MNILFICSGNTCRSPLAEMIARRILAEHHLDAETCSAGILTADGIPWSEHTLSIAAQQGLDTQGHRSVQVRQEHLNRADLILVMASRHLESLKRMFPEETFRDKTFLLKEYLDATTDGNNEVRDPYGESLNSYLEVTAELERILCKLPDKLLTDH